MDLWEKSSVKLFSFIIAVNFLGAVSGFISMNNMSWYNSLNQPVFSPPSIVFPIVWTIMYTLIGVAGYRIYSKDLSRTVKNLFVAQLALNYLWSPVFFLFQLPLAGLLVIMGILSLTFVLVMELEEDDKTSAYLLTPYLIWLMFALLLNLQIVVLN